MLLHHTRAHLAGSRSPACSANRRLVGRAMATIQRFDTGPRLSEMVIHNGTVYLAGQVRVFQLQRCELGKQATFMGTATIGHLVISTVPSVANFFYFKIHICLKVPEDTSVDAREQTASVLKQIDELLARAGTDKTKILSAQVKSYLQRNITKRYYLMRCTCNPLPCVAHIRRGLHLRKEVLQMRCHHSQAQLPCVEETVAAPPWHALSISSLPVFP